MKILIIIAALAFAGCSRTPTWKDDPDKIAKLAPDAQAAVLWNDALWPFGLAAIFWTLNGGSVVKIIRKIKTEKAD